MSALVEQLYPKSLNPRLNESPPFLSGPALLRRGDHVFHERWGVGRVLFAGANTSDEATIGFDDGPRSVSPDGLRRLLTRTAVAQLIETSAPTVSKWMVRKADNQGVIEPDVKGRFAGHAVHYYDAARIPGLIEQLSEQQNSWSTGTMVLHPRYGPGRVAAWQSRFNGSIDAGMRLVEFFADSSRLIVSIEQLRRLLPSHVVAERLGLNRKTFAKGAKRKGVFPDYVTSDGPAREFYDEGRIEDIQERWSAIRRGDSFLPGCIVQDRQGEIARVEFRDAHGQLHVRYRDSSGHIQPVDPAGIRKLVSLRELARSERMSRYKLNRLLTAAGILPIYQDGHANYFDGNKAREAVRDRLSREASAVSLAALAKRTGISAPVLARKIHHGCICTTGQAAYAVDRCEAERIEDVVRTLRSRDRNLETLGVCRLHSRGRKGQEVAAWDLSELIKVAQPLPPLQREGLFGQVAWLCDGAGRLRLIEALKSYILTLYKTIGDDRQVVRSAQVLLALLDYLPKEFTTFRSRLAFLASEAPQVYGSMTELRNLARDAGLRSPMSCERFHTQINESVAELLTSERLELSLALNGSCSAKTDRSYPEDDFVPNAIVVCVKDQKPEVGVIVRVEQQAWNAVLCRWDKTIVVRFSNEERRMNPHTRTANAHSTQSNGDMVVLLRAVEAIAVLHRIRERSKTVQLTGRRLVRGSMQKAS